MNSLSVVFALALAAVGIEAGGDIFWGGYPTYPDVFWCRRHCFFRTPWYWRTYCYRYCYRLPGSVFFLAQPACGKLALWEPQDTCEGLIQRFGIPSKEAFKALNPFFEPDCDGVARPEFAGLMFCAKELGPGEEAQPLPCQQFHAVASDEKTLDDVGKKYDKTTLELAVLNPTVNPIELVHTQILCIVRDDQRALPPPCDVFYPFGPKEDPNDCSAIVKQFVSESFPLEELNRLNPDHPCDLTAPKKLIPGQMICLRQPKDTATTTD